MRTAVTLSSRCLIGFMSCCASREADATKPPVAGSMKVLAIKPAVGFECPSSRRSLARIAPFVAAGLAVAHAIGRKEAAAGRCHGVYEKTVDAIGGLPVGGIAEHGPGARIS